MFIERACSKRFLLAPAERNGLAYHCRKHCAPLARVVLTTGFYKHSAPPEAEYIFGCGLSHAENSSLSNDDE